MERRAIIGQARSCDISKCRFNDLKPSPRQFGSPREATGRFGSHTFRGAGVAAYLKNGGTLEKEREMATHVDTRTTRLYDRRARDVSLVDVERISI
jgi:hypothetical protein